MGSSIECIQLFATWYHCSLLRLRLRRVGDPAYNFVGRVPLRGAYPKTSPQLRIAVRLSEILSLLSAYGLLCS